MSRTEKTAILLAVVQVGLFVMDGLIHNATWLVSISGACMSAALIPWICATSNYRRRSVGTRR